MGHGEGGTSGMSVKQQRSAREAFAEEGEHQALHVAQQSLNG